MLDEDPFQTQAELASALEITRQAISKRLHALGMIQKQGTWVPYDLKPRDVERRFFACEQLLQRQKRSMAHGLADQQFCSYEDIEKWLDSWVASKDERFYRNVIQALPKRWAKIVGNDGQYLE